MKKLYVLLCCMVGCVSIVFGADGTTFSLWDLLKSIFFNGGWLILLYVFFRVVIWIVRRTSNQTDDKILDSYVSKAVEFALTVIPEPDKTNVNWVKFVGNALSQFSLAYTKGQGDSPDATTFDKAKKIIEEVANKVELKNVKEVLEQYKNNKEVA